MKRPPPPPAAHRSSRLDRFQVPAQPRNARSNAPPVDFELLLSRSASPDAAAQARELAVAAGEPGQQILQLSELHLRPRLARARVPCEDIEDEPGPIEHPNAFTPPLLEVARLRRSQLIIEDDETGILRTGRGSDLLDRALSNVGRRVRRCPLLHKSRDDLGSGRVGEPAELV